MGYNGTQQFFLGDLYDISSGISKNKEQFGSGYPFLSFKTVFNYTIIPTDLKDLAQTTLSEQNKYSILYGDVFLTRTSETANELGMSSVALKDYPQATFNGFTKRLRPKKGVMEFIDPKFIAYYLRSKDFRNQIDSISVLTTRASLNQGMIEKLTITVPNIETQKKIAAILSALDEKIAINRAINDNLLEQMQAIYKSWFVDYLPFGGVMPESWTQTGIYSLANIIYGAPFASKQFNTEGSGKPIIRIRDLKDQQFATYTTEVHPKGYLLRPGDIVVGMDGEFRPYIWGNDEAWLNQRVCVFENKRPKGKAFLYFTIKPLLYAIEQTQVATTVIHIGKKDYDAFEIMLPDDATLDSFDSLTAPMIMQIVSSSFENKRLAAMRDALLPKLMSGEINIVTIK